MMQRLMETWSELCAHRSVLWQLVRQHLILRYRRTALGYVWTLINPLLMMTVTAVVFASLFQVNLKNYAVFLFAGMIPWNCFNSCVVQSGTSFIRNEGLIKKIYLPKTLFPLSVVVGLLIDSALSFIVLFLIILTIGGQLSWALLFIPVAYVLLFFFSLGVALVVSVATVFFRDLQYVVTVAMQALFFLSPVLYRKDELAGKIAWVVGLNPVAPFIDLFRAPLHASTVPTLSVITGAFGLAVLSMMIGLAVFILQERNIVFRL